MAIFDHKKKKNVQLFFLQFFGHQNPGSGLDPGPYPYSIRIRIQWIRIHTPQLCQKLYKSGVFLIHILASSRSSVSVDYILQPFLKNVLFCEIFHEEKHVSKQKRKHLVLNGNKCRPGKMWRLPDNFIGFFTSYFGGNDSEHWTVPTLYTVQVPMPVCPKMQSNNFEPFFSWKKTCFTTARKSFKSESYTKSLSDMFCCLYCTRTYDPYLWLTNPAIFVSDLQDLFFPFFCLLLFETTFKPIFIDKKS